MGLLVRVPAKYGTRISLRLESKLTFTTMCTHALPKDKYILEVSSIQLYASCCKKHVILFSHGLFFP